LILGAVVVLVGALIAVALLSRPIRETAKAVSLGANKLYREDATSMEPSIYAGDKMAATTNYGTIRRGDVVVVKSPVPGEKSDVKRVAALPGDTISTIASIVWLNGTRLKEPYAQGPTLGLRATTVPSGSYYLLGDNRMESRDSRFDGSVPKARVVGVVLRIVAPSAHAGRVRGSSR
jgi:signal peptidase I